MLDYLLVFKMSQDPLELFFGSIQASLGYNNNPTVAQFKSSYTKLSAGALVRAGSGSNCLWTQNFAILDSNTFEKEKERENEKVPQQISLEDILMDSKNYE